MMGACMVSGRASVPQSTRSVTLPAMSDGGAHADVLAAGGRRHQRHADGQNGLKLPEALSRMVMRLPVSTRVAGAV